MPDPVQVQSMFGRIARHYDTLNRVLSLGIDQRWRRAAVARVQKETSGELRRVVDACCGTGDLTLALADQGLDVVGADFTPELLVRGAAKGVRQGAERALFAHGDALRLPLHDGACDAATVAFGIRNVEDRTLGLRELGRVVRPGGIVLVLEFQVPRGPLGWVYRQYFERVLPRVGGWFSKDKSAYTYLRDTVLAWPSAEELELEMEAIGFEGCGFQRRTFGIVALHWGRVPVARRDGAGESPAPEHVEPLPTPSV